MQPFEATLAYAERLDAADPLARFRSEFEFSVGDDGTERIYMVGNSLGLLPKRTREYVNTELDRWGRYGVEGHFTGDLAWEPYHELLTAQMADVVGGQHDEVVVMNALTVNLHLLLISFYQPTAERHKILIEAHAFPSDHFAVESQIRQRGFDPATSLIAISPREGSETLEPQDILDAIAQHGNELAVVLLPGVQYYTGQVMPMEQITAAGHGVGAKVGFDLAHAAGNVPVRLHDWGVDFAAWCTYKYLNSGPGGVAGAYVHQRWLEDQTLPKLLGWWGTAKETRFQMKTTYEPIPTVESWQLSNAPILSMAALRASLDIVTEAGGIQALRGKSLSQIRYFDQLLHAEIGEGVKNLTPAALDERGAQFALSITDPQVDGRKVYEDLEAAGVACDWRHPNVIRVAPVPLYNSFVDIYRFVHVLKGLLP